MPYRLWLNFCSQLLHRGTLRNKGEGGSSLRTSEDRNSCTRRWSLRRAVAESFFSLFTCRVLSCCLDSGAVRLGEPWTTASCEPTVWGFSLLWLACEAFCPWPGLQGGSPPVQSWLMPEPLSCTPTPAASALRRGDATQTGISFQGPPSGSGVCGFRSGWRPRVGLLALGSTSQVLAPSQAGFSRQGQQRQRCQPQACIL